MDSRKDIRTPRRPRLTPKPRTAIHREKPPSGRLEQDPVDVFCRVRPLNQDSESCITILNNETLQIGPPSSQLVTRSGAVRGQHYKFRKIFNPDSCQKDVFDEVAKPLVADLLKGKNGLLFAYGVTGSGKTHTMQGIASDGGIVPRTLDVVFNSISKWQDEKCVFKPDHLNGFDVSWDPTKSNKLFKKLYSSNKENRNKPVRNKLSGGSSIIDSSNGEGNTLSEISGLDEDNVYAVFITYLEAYNNFIYDLLEEIPDNNMTKNLQSKVLREDGNHNMYVNCCNEVEVRSTQEALHQLKIGQRRRKVAHTSLNAESSRSHSIFNIRVVQCPLDEQGERVKPELGITVSQLSLVDLAGSERTSRTRAAGLRVKEAGNINNTLMTLRSCIEVLRENQLNNASRIPPFRDSKITHYFKNYFEGNGKVNMVICVNPVGNDYEETLSVMKFAELASEVQVQRSVRPHTVAVLPSGRRKANELFREVRRNMQVDFERAKELEVDIDPIYALNPAWPSLSMTPEVWHETSQNLMEFLQKRLEKREILAKSVEEKAKSVVERNMALETENIVLRQENASLQALDVAREVKLREYESRLKSADGLIEEYNNLVEKYNVVMEERDMARSKGALEKERLKAKTTAKLVGIKIKKDEELANELKEFKSRMVRNQVKALQEMTGNTPSGSDSTRPYTRQATRQPPHTPGCAVSNSRHRRSFSQGAINVVLDHRPLKTLDTNTVHRPVLTKRKSVSRLKASDVNSPKHTHYCLTTQNNDSDGGIETKMYKADILPTTGGGSQVVFNDVEILKQKDPLQISGGVKRDSDGEELRNQFDSVVQQERWRNLTNTPNIGNSPAPYKRPKY